MLSREVAAHPKDAEPDDGNALVDRRRQRLPPHVYDGKLRFERILESFNQPELADQSARLFKDAVARVETAVLVGAACDQFVRTDGVVSHARNMEGQRSIQTVQAVDGNQDVDAGKLLDGDPSAVEMRNG